MIEDVNDKNYPQVIKFLEESKLVNNIQENLVKYGSVVIQNEQVMGMISYEINKSDYKKAVLRYFIFKKTLEVNIVLELIKYITNKLKLKKVNKLIGFVSSKDVLKVMLDFGFYELDPQYVYVDEECYEKSDYKKVIPLALDI